MSSALSKTNKLNNLLKNIKVSAPESKDKAVRPTMQCWVHFLLYTFLFFGNNTVCPYLMVVCGRLRVREYNTLHRAIRRSRWGPVRCTIALYLKMEMVKGYAHWVWNTESISDRANRGRISFIRNYAQQSSSVSRGKCRDERTICGTNSN